MIIYNFVIWMIKMLLAHLSNTLLISSSDDKSGEEDKAGRNDWNTSGQNKKVVMSNENIFSDSASLITIADGL